MTLLVTGGSGTLGSAICSAALKQGKTVVAFSRDKSRQLTQCPRGTILETGDITDQFRLVQVCRDHDVTQIVHCAAMKHIGDCEQHPRSTLNTNLLSLPRLCSAMKMCDIPSLVFVSSDKAGDNTLYGSSKLWGERLVAEFSAQYSPTICSVRLGNLLGSNGSVVDLWKTAITKGDPIRINVNDGRSARRFVMHSAEAAQFILGNLDRNRHGVVLARKMPVVTIDRLQQAMFPDVPFRFGALPKDQVHQDLIRDSESRKTARRGDEYFLDHILEDCGGEIWTYGTHSETPMTVAETKAWVEQESAIPDNAVCS